MKVRVKYLGRRPDALKAVKLKKFVKGPYDFSKGECMMEEKDADILILRDPIGFKITADAEEVAAEEVAAARASKK